MTPTLRIQLFGDFNLTRDGAPVEGLNTARLQALLAYLALRRDTPQARQRLAFLFWPDSNEAQARNNLRQLLHALRHALPDADALLAVDNRTLQWRRDADIQVDVEEFAATLAELAQAEQRNDTAAVAAAGERLLTLYRADLLPGCYDEWIAPERERLRERFTQALTRLIHLHETQLNYAVAIRYARRLLEADALDEEAHRQMMRLHALSGDRAGELRAYQHCGATLQRELGVEPDQATKDLHEQLQRLVTSATPGVDRWSAPTDAARPRTPTAPAYIGRQRELDLLRRAWQTASAQGPAFALITGEPGIGKSRLAEEVARWAGSLGATTATARSYAVEGRLALAPVVAWLRSPLLRPHIDKLPTVWLTEVARVLPELLDERPDLPHYEPIDDYGQRQRFFHALTLAILAAPQPLLLVMDDLQWCDQETLEWLHFLLRFDAAARLLVVGIARDEETPPQHPLHALTHHLRRHVPVTELALQPLDAAETAALAAHLLDSTLDTLSALRLFKETEGNPLFVIETAHAELEAAPGWPAPADTRLARSIDTSELPSGVRAVIAGRLAQLSPAARELASLAALLGREFTLDVLLQVSQDDEHSVVRALEELWRRRIVRELGPATYDFTHDKLREVAQSEISAPQRHLWHRRIAAALEARHTDADALDPASAQIAAHYEQGGAPDRAIPHYQRAALVAQRMFAYEDAIRLLKRALTLLEQAPSDAARDKKELRIQLALAPLYRIARGWTAPELERVLDRTLALCDIVGDDTQRAEALYGLQSMLVVQARLGRVQVVAEELHALYARMGRAAPPLLDMMLAGARLHLGRLTEANDAFERILVLPLDVVQARNVQEVQGWNYVAHTRAWHAHAQWLLGYTERALRLGQDGVQLAQRLEEPFNQALAATYLAMFWQMSDDGPTARVYAEEAFALAQEYKAPYYRAWAAILVAYAHAREAPDETRISALRAAIEEFQTSGARLRLPYYLALLARVYAQAQRPEEGLAVIEEALAHARDTSERWWDAELHRLRGELLFAAGREPLEVEDAFLRAAAIAQSQGALTLELRAQLARLRLPASAPQIDAARGASAQAPAALDALRDVYARFHEGFDSPDLLAAQALLRQAANAHLTP